MTNSPTDLLDVDTLATILSFLPWEKVMDVRICCHKWKEAAEHAPISKVQITTRKIGAGLESIVRALPNIQAIEIDRSRRGFESFDLADGRGASVLSLQFDYEGMGLKPPPAPVSLDPIGFLKNLEYLKLSQTRLNGAHPYIFHFKNLKTLDLLWNPSLRWDLSMLAGFPCLENLYCPQNHELTGDVDHLKVLNQTLRQVKLCHCPGVTGNFSSFFRFPVLEDLDLNGTQVTGDLREIGDSDFPSLKKLEIGDSIYGGGDIESISDAPKIMETKYILKKRIPSLFENRRWHLRDDSAERYEFFGHHSRAPPFWVEFVEAGPRIGWRWTNAVSGGDCETHWFNEEPLPSDDGYEAYIEKIKRERPDFYQNFFRPPTEEQHAQLCRETPLDPMLARFSNQSSFTGWW